MENPCTLILFGDSIIRGCASTLEALLRRDYPEIELSLINAGVPGETSRDGLARMLPLLDEKPDVVVIGFGMNDWRKGVGRAEFRKNLTRMLVHFEEKGARVILTTVSAAYDFESRRSYPQPDDYSEVVREIAYEKKIKIADINALWKAEFSTPQGLRDDIHPDKKGIALICKALMWVVTRQYTTVLWQYNGREARCNYRCPYCYYFGLHSPQDMFVGPIEKWRDSFIQSFGSQKIVLYLAFGEPTLGRNFVDIVRMVDAAPGWQLRLTSNISCNLQEIAAAKSAREGRLHINASFHPCMVSRDDFLKRILFLRSSGIEVPIVYVAYPPYFERFEDDIAFFRSHEFVVHVRRLQGSFNNLSYPRAYTDREARLIAKYSDDGTVKYMLNEQPCQGKRSFAGMHFFIIDNMGNAGYDSNIFTAGTPFRGILGNVHDNTFKPNTLPEPYPGQWVGTVDGVANIVEFNYKELENNNVLSFARQGGVYRTAAKTIVYANEHRDFNDPAVRAEYNFPRTSLRRRVMAGVKRVCGKRTRDGSEAR